MDRLSSCFTRGRDVVCYELARPPVKEACAEFLATFALVVLGNGVIASCVLGRLDVNSVLAGAFGWGFAVMIAVAIAGGVSGGHVNPAVTIALAIVKKCPMKHVVPYVFAQNIASFLAAVVVFFTYRDAINTYDGGFREVPPSINATAQIFATYPQDFASISTCFVDQVLGTSLLLILICAATDSRNLRIPPHTQPIFIGLGIMAILLAFGHNCGAPLNPARDFGPRVFTGLFGWGSIVFSYRNWQWMWIPIIGPIVGGIVGVLAYKAFIEMPFTSYTRLLEELETPEFVEENSRRLAGLIVNVPHSPLEKSNSSEGGAQKHSLDQVVPEMENPKASGASLEQRTLKDEERINIDAI